MAKEVFEIPTAEELAQAIAGRAEAAEFGKRPDVIGAVVATGYTSGLVTTLDDGETTAGSKGFPCILPLDGPLGAGEKLIKIKVGSSYVVAKIGTPNVVTPLTGFTLTAGAAIAVNTRTGDLFRTYAAVTQDDSSSLLVPSGKTLKILSVTLRCKTGATNGSYNVKAQLKNVTDNTYTDLASGSVTVSGGAAQIIDVTSFGSTNSPLATLAAGKRWNLVIYNNSTSAGATDATSAALASISYVYV